MAIMNLFLYAAPVLESIAITTPPSKTAYNYGEYFSPTGMVVTATYSGGLTEVVTGWTYSPTGALNHSSTTVTISYTDGGVTKTATQAITVAKVLSSIAITTPPTKTSYFAGEGFNSAGMVVQATYSDDTTSNVVSSCTFSPSTMVSGTTSVQVTYTYNGVTKYATQAVSVTVVSTTLENNSWETIALISSQGRADEFWNVGNLKKLSLDGRNYYMQIVGFNHDNLNSSDAKYSDSSYNGGTKKAGITFALLYIHNDGFRMNITDTNEGGWNSCYMRTGLLDSWLRNGYFPTELENVLRTVNKFTSAGNRSTSITTSPDRLFLFSYVEVFGATLGGVNGEGTQYAYWAAGNSAKKNYVNSDVISWWLRSSVYNDSFVLVNSAGKISTDRTASCYYGVVFGFCI